MDDDSKQLLRQLVDAQREQTELLRKHALPLWTRIRFSLLALFVLMTLMATGVGFTVLAIRSTNAAMPTRQPAILNPPNARTFQVWPTLTVDVRNEADGNLQTWPTPSVDVQTTTPTEDTVQVWPTPRVDIRTYDGQMGKEASR
jgi:hypothetical protein